MNVVVAQEFIDSPVTRTVNGQQQPTGARHREHRQLIITPDGTFKLVRPVPGLPDGGFKFVTPSRAALIYSRMAPCITWDEALSIHSARKSFISQFIHEPVQYDQRGQRDWTYYDDNGRELEDDELTSQQRKAISARSGKVGANVKFYKRYEKRKHGQEAPGKLYEPCRCGHPKSRCQCGVDNTAPITGRKKQHARTKLISRGEQPIVAAGCTAAGDFVFTSVMDL